MMSAQLSRSEAHMSDNMYMLIFSAALLIPVIIALAGDWLIQRKK